MTEEQTQHMREMIARGVALYGVLLNKAGEAVDGELDWTHVRRSALHMSANLSYIVNIIKTHQNRAMVRLAMVLLANCVSFAAARQPEEVKMNRLTKSEDLGKLLNVM